MITNVKWGPDRMMRRMSSTSDSRATDLSGVRSQNLESLLRLLRQRGPTSRADLAEQTGLTKVAVSDLATELLSLRLVREADVPVSGGRGRPARPLSLSGERVAGIGLWLDVDRLAVQVVDFSGEARWRRSRRIDNRAARIDTTVRRTARLLDEAIDWTGAQGLDVGSVVVSVPGLIGAERQQLFFAPNLGWQEVALAARLREQSAHAPHIILENEANASALAERACWSVGERASLSDYIYVSMGVGIGAGIVVGGELFRGARGFGGELGHGLVVAQGAKCSCGGRGCLETVVGREAILARARARLGRRFAATDSGGEPMDALSALASSGDRVALEVVDEVADWLVAGLATYANLFDPQAIIVGGHGQTLAEHLCARIEAGLARQVLGARWVPTRVRRSLVGNDAPLTGAGLLALEQVARAPRRVGAPGK